MSALKKFFLNTADGNLVVLCQSFYQSVNLFKDQPLSRISKEFSFTCAIASIFLFIFLNCLLLLVEIGVDYRWMKYMQQGFRC